MTEQMKKNLLIGVVVLGIAVIGIGFYLSMYSDFSVSKNAKTPKAGQDVSKNDMALPKPTGKVTDAADSALSSIKSEELLDQQVDKAADASVDDGSDITSFSQTYDEKSL